MSRRLDPEYAEFLRANLMRGMHEHGKPKIIWMYAMIDNQIVPTWALLNGKRIVQCYSKDVRELIALAFGNFKVTD